MVRPGEQLLMPLETECKGSSGNFNRLNDAIIRTGSGDDAFR